MTTSDARLRRVLSAARDGKLAKDTTGFMVDRYPRVDLDVTEDARAATADGLLGTVYLPPNRWATAPVPLTDAGRDWLEAHSEKTP